MHVKGSLIYNHILHEKKLLTRFQEIQEGDKIKYVLLRKPNTHQTNVISFLTKLPPQFNFHSVIDYETQFQKSFFEPLKFILEAINWKVDASGMNTIESFLSKYKPYNLKDVNEASSQNKFNVISTFAWWWWVVNWLSIGRW